MDIKNLARAARQAFLNCDTKSIKGILRRGSHDSYIFPLVAEGRIQLSTRDIFSIAHTTVPGFSPHYHVWRMNFKDSLGNVLLHLAASISDLELMTLLVEKRADITSINSDGRTPLHVACEKVSLNIVKFLTEKSPKYILEEFDYDKGTPLNIACRYSCPEVVKFLLSQGASVVKSQDLGLPGPLLEAVSDSAVYAKPIASLLLDAGVNIDDADVDGKTALITAIAAFRWDAANFIPISENHSRVDLCMFLTDRGCDVNAADLRGKTALHFAIEIEQEILVRNLLFSGSHVESRDNFGRTPLYYACKIGNQRIVDLLINFGAILGTHDWKNALNSPGFPLKSELVLSYVIHKSRHCFTLENLCCMNIRRNFRNLEKYASHLGLPPLLVKRLQLRQ